jgi:general secretion pathway protein C
MIGIGLLGAQIVVALHVVALGVTRRVAVWTAPACEGVHAPLIAAAADEQVSVAALARAGESRGTLRHRGEIFDGRMVVFIEPERVWMARGRELCRAEMFNAPVHVEAASGKPLDARPLDAGALPPLVAKGIVRTSPTDFVLDASVRDQLLEGQATFLRGARLAPDQQDGKTLGYRVYGARPGTLLSAVGIVDGDRISTLNGYDLTSPQRALEAYARLQTANRLTLAIVRGGKAMNLDYEIR